MIPIDFLHGFMAGCTFIIIVIASTLYILMRFMIKLVSTLDVDISPKITKKDDSNGQAGNNS